MARFNIYMAGSMSNLSLEKQMEWRIDLKNKILLRHPETKPRMFMPPLYYNTDDVCHKTEKEAMLFDLNVLRNSNLVVARIDNAVSTGTAMEIAIAYELKIPILILNECDYKLHAWVFEMATRVCDSREEICEHIVDYYLN